MGWLDYNPFAAPIFSRPPQNPNDPVLYRTASPLINITKGDIDKGINIAMSAGPGSIKGTAPEKIVSAATKFDGKIYEGQTHGDAFEKYIAERAANDSTAAGAYGGDGFITSTGRFVDRQEAQKIAEIASQVPTYTGKAWSQLYAEELAGPKTNK